MTACPEFVFDNGDVTDVDVDVDVGVNDGGVVLVFFCFNTSKLTLIPCLLFLCLLFICDVSANCTFWFFCAWFKWREILC